LHALTQAIQRLKAVNCWENAWHALAARTAKEFTSKTILFGFLKKSLLFVFSSNQH
jgi:hypothetical protein